MPKSRNKSSDWVNNHLIATLLLIPIITGVISTFIVLGVQYATAPRADIQILHREWFTNLTDAQKNSYTNTTDIQRAVGTRSVEIKFQNTGKADCDYLNFTVHTANGINVYWYTNVPTNITTSTGIPFIKLTNSYGGAVYSYGVTNFSVFVQGLEPGEIGWISFNTENFTMFNGTALSKKGYAVSISDVSLCQGGSYRVSNYIFNAYG